jgi:predicted nucleic acid-binding protein
MVAPVKSPVLLDNTVLTNLALVERGDLATELWPGRACTTPAVWQEYQRAVTGGLVLESAWPDLPLVKLSERESRFAAELGARLGAGERTCLAVALHRRGLFASDDLDARRVAGRYEIPITGTLGILVRCVQQGSLARQEADRLLSQMIALGYRSLVTDLSVLLEGS